MNQLFALHSDGVCSRLLAEGYAAVAVWRCRLSFVNGEDAFQLGFVDA